MVGWLGKKKKPCVEISTSGGGTGFGGNVVNSFKHVDVSSYVPVSVLDEGLRLGRRAGVAGRD